MASTQKIQTGQTQSGVDLSKRKFLVAGSTISGTFLLGLPTLSLADARIVGVQTGQYRSGAILRATRWHIVGAGLRKEFPDLRRPLALYGL